MRNNHENPNDYGHNQIHTKNNLNDNQSLKQNKKQGEQGQNQLLSKYNANSVNSSALIFKARQIYQKYKKPSNRQSHFDKANHPQIITLQGNDASKPDARKIVNSQRINSNNKSNAKFEQIFIKKDSINFKNELATAETVPSSTSIQVKRIDRDSNKLQNFLYMLIGIYSSHLRVIQRFAFQRIFHHQRSVKQTAQLKKRLTKIDSLSSENLLLEESTVEKGLKFLQERSNKRKKLQMQMRQSPYLQQKMQYQVRKQKNEQKNTPNREDTFEQQRFEQSGHKKQIRNFEQEISPRRFETEPIHQIYQFKNKNNKQNIQTQQQEDIYLRLEREQQRNKERGRDQEKQKEQQRQRQNKKQKESQRKDLIIQNQKTSWIILQLNEKPLQIINKRQLFERKQVSQRRYYLNPNLYQQAEPDVNNQLFVPSNIDFFSDHNEDEIEPQFNKKFGQRTTTDFNLHEEALPTFEAQRGSGIKKNQSSGQQYLNFQSKQGSLIKQSKINELDPQYEYKQFDNLPSFNGKKIILVKNQGNFIQKNQNEQRQRRKSDLMGYKSRESSFKISDEGEDFIDETNVKMNFKKLHRLQQYYTDNNVMSKNSGRPSFDSSKHKLKKPSRPKSMSHAAQSSYQQIFIPQMEQKKIQINQIFKESYAKPTIRISYQSPQNKIVVNSHAQQHFPIMSNIKPNLEFHNEVNKKLIPIATHNQNVANKPRAISSEPRLIGQVYFQRPPPILQPAYRPQIIKPNNNFLIQLNETQQLSPRMVSSGHNHQYNTDNYAKLYPPRLQYSMQPSQMAYSTPSIIQSRPAVQSQYQLNSKQNIAKKKGIQVNMSPRKADQTQLNHYKSQTQLHQLRPSPRKQGEAVKQGSNSKRLQTITTQYF